MKHSFNYESHLEHYHWYATKNELGIVPKNFQLPCYDDDIKFDVDKISADFLAIHEIKKLPKLRKGLSHYGLQNTQCT